jgi:AraC-like DNA-binding protein
MGDIAGDFLRTAEYDAAIAACALGASMQFDTATLPQRQRFAAFRDGFVRYVATEIIKHDETPFQASLSFWRGNAVSVATLGTSPAVFLRTPKHLRDGDDSLSVIVCRRGRYHAAQRDQSQTLHPGEGVLFDHGNLAEVRTLRDGQRCSVKIPRARLLLLAPHAERAIGQKIARNSPELQLLVHHLDAPNIAGLLPGSPLGDLFEEHALHLTAHLLGAGGAARELVEHGGVRQARLQAIVREIDARSGEPELSAVVVAAKLGVTPRYVHRLLEETGNTFSERVLQRRLDCALALLSDPRQNSRKIVDIAFEAGFIDVSHFNRSFRRRFGNTPSGVRRGARRD